MKSNELEIMQPALQCQNKLNFQPTPVCTMYCAAVLHSPTRKIQYGGDFYEYVDCDYIRGIIPCLSVSSSSYIL
jgi:hypothetical protein